jgi:hypothetical protein
MPTNRRGSDHDKEQEGQIQELQQHAERLAMGEMIAWESPTLPPEESEQFWRCVVEYAAAPSTNHFQQLTGTGIELPDPNAMDDETLSSTLWEVISALARMRVFLSQTDHLNDRELYTLLWRDVLREEIPLLAEDVNAAWHVDVLGSASDADTALYLKYYADETERQQWLTDFPDYAMPAHERPPYDRDRHLPKPYEERPSH